MAAKITACFTFLKEALILPTLNPKLFAPVLVLFAVTAFLDPLVHVVFVHPLADGMASRLSEINSTDPSSAEYAKLIEKLTETEEMKQVGKRMVRITIAKFTVGPALGLVKQILALFAASTTYSGDRYSLAGLLRELVTRRISLKGPSITIAVVGALDFTGAVLAALMGGRSGVLSVQGLVSLIAHLASLCLTVIALVGVAASVADSRKCRGVRALRQAWRLVTRVRRKEGLVLVLVAYLGPTVVAPLHRFALGYAKRSMAACLCLMAVYALLSGAQQLFSLAAATVYYYQAMESKEVIDDLWLC
ncbi:hypothetical protein CFC21_025787 [Triticum aestivum]|uniref:Uncharacterized protein n=2 Tax=Triticum aestivum TaxID=4565 RepID=A0A9R1JBJ9_WHEAT|nr:uncharacterized protein LOC119365917 [Triticum dicoccoides]XP_044326354.1 uncharacterized protein LOC123046959 [Triticum aestivum]KAF7011478.1 hypothetical protein CFC21_025785 [Triticum aestivum]KAF7011480.1 hypothetical protein CFC21_025787 [Triticum aestivum]